jgi:hypothetical protein
MGWQQKLTTFYNLVKQSMDKIVEPPNPEKGQIRKVKRGNLNIHKVIDWSVSAGLLVNK